MENPSRRRMLVAGLTGAAVTVLGAPRASATTPPDSTTPGSTASDSTTPGTGSSAATTPPTTAAPQRPTDADTSLLAWAQGLELAAADLYQVAIDAGAAGDSDRVLAAGRDQHRGAGNVVSGLIGTAAPQRADQQFVTERTGDFETSDPAAAATAAMDLENTLIATYTEMTGKLASVDAAKLIAAIAVGHARRCVALTDLSGQGDDLAVVFENGASALALPQTEEG